MSSPLDKFILSIKSGDNIKAERLFRDNEHLQSEVNLDEPQSIEGTILHLVSIHAMPGILNRLLERPDADPFNKNNKGQTCLHCVCRSSNGNDPKKMARSLECLIHLLDWGSENCQNLDVKLNQTDKDNKTALHYAVSANKEKLVKQLLERGVNLEIKDKIGKKPIDYAKGDNLKKMLKETPKRAVKSTYRKVEEVDIGFTRKMKDLEREGLNVFRENEIRQSADYLGRPDSVIKSFRAKWLRKNEGNIDVVIAYFKKTRPKDLEGNAILITSLEHQNICRLIGVLLTPSLDIRLITQYMPLGTLNTFVRRYSDSLEPATVLGWCIQIAEAMQYISTQRIVLRDLAARNILVQNRHLIKIANFRMARLVTDDEDYFQGSQDEHLPVQWLPPESFQEPYRHYLIKGDVWGYGVTVWEILSYGEEPYSRENERVEEIIHRDDRLPKPDICQSNLYRLLERCWDSDYEMRPTFEDLIEKLNSANDKPERFINTSVKRLPNRTRSSFPKEDEDKTNNSEKLIKKILDEMAKKAQKKRESERVSRLQIPEEIRKGDETSIQKFTEAMRNGVENVYHVRIMVIGPVASGKTSLTNRLLGNNLDKTKKSKTRKSTNGIDIGTCVVSIPNKEWIRNADAELNPFDHDARTAKILFKMNADDMRPKEPKRAQSISFSLPTPTQEKSDSFAAKSNDVIAPESTGLTENAELPTTKVSDTNKEVSYTSTKDQDQPKSINPEKLKSLKTATRKAKELGPKGKGDISDVSVWDFGGHFVFYSTHQVFMSRRAIYLAVTDITKDAEEIMNHDKYLMDMSGKTDMKYGESLMFWLNSVSTYCGEDKRGPPVILVVTHTDQLKGNKEEKIKQYFENVRKILGKYTVYFELADEDFAINNLIDDPNIEKLRQKILNLAKKQPYWGEEIPASYILLEKAIFEERKKGQRVFNLDEVKAIVEKQEIPITGSGEDIQTFLKFEHAIGNVMYFAEEKLQNLVVLDPQWLIDAFKCIITKTNLHLQAPKVVSSMAEFEQSAKLTPDTIEMLWTMDGSESSFYQFKDIILDIMERLDIIVNPSSFPTESSTEPMKEEFYFVPSMVKATVTDEDLFSISKGAIATQYLCFKFETNFLPPAIFHRLMAACMAQWPVAKQRNEPLLYCGCAVFALGGGPGICRLLLCLVGHVIQLQISCYEKSFRESMIKLCIDVRDFICESLAKIFQRFQQHLAYKLHIKCSRSSRLCLGGLFEVEELKQHPKVVCHYHDSHPEYSYELLKDWFREEAKELGPKGKGDISDVSVWDFGGHFVFYSTHQVFMSRRAIYLAVTDITKDAEEIMNHDKYLMDMSGKTDMKYGESLMFWLNSVSTYCGEDKRGPPVILVVTHTDQLKGNKEEKIKQYFENVRKILGKYTVYFELADEDFAINNLIDDPNIEKLRQKILNLAKKQPYWGEEIPASYILLEKAIFEERKKGQRVFNLDEVKAIVEKQEIPITGSGEDIQTFLKFEHAIGNVMYFAEEKLQNLVVLDPQWLIDAFKCIITKTNLHLQAPKVVSSMAEFEQSAKLTPDTIEMLWTMDGSESSFYQFKDIILDIMERLDIIVNPSSFPTESSTEPMKEEFYFVPSMVKATVTDEDLFSISKGAIATQYLCFKFETNFLPPAIFHRLMAACMAQWPVAKQRNEPLLYCGCAVFALGGGPGICRLLLCLVGHVIQLQISCYEKSFRESMIKLCIDVRDFICESLAKIFQRFQQHLAYKLHIKCSRSSRLCLGGLFEVEELKQHPKVVCHYHDSHPEYSYELLKDWFREEEIPPHIRESGTDIQSNVPLEARNRCPKEDELSRLSQKIGLQYYMLAIRLGVSSDKIGKIKSENRDGLDSVIFNVLLHWAKQGNATFGALEKEMKGLEMDLSILYESINTG